MSDRRLISSRGQCCGRRRRRTGIFSQGHNLGGTEPLLRTLYVWGQVRRRNRMSAASQYRRTAADCSAITAFLLDPQRRAAVLALAAAWTRLAEQADRNAQAVPLDEAAR
jgi:hypothetical protein